MTTPTTSASPVAAAISTATTAAQLDLERRALAAEQARLRAEAEALQAERRQLEEERLTFRRSQTLAAKRGLSASLHDLTFAAEGEEGYASSSANTVAGTLRRGGHHAALCKSVSRLSTVSTESTRTENESTTTTLSSSSGSSGSLAAALQSEIRRRAEKSTAGS